jgi:hypothetical protein
MIQRTLLCSLALLNASCTSAARRTDSSALGQDHLKISTSIPTALLETDLTPAEPHIAVDPSNPDRVSVMAIMSRDLTKRNWPRNYTWSSNDGGKTWTSAESFAEVAYPGIADGGGGDPVLAFAPDGMLLATTSGLIVDGPNAVMEIVVGRTRPERPVFDVIARFGTVRDPIKTGAAADVSWIAVDQSKGSRRGTAYVSWSEMRGFLTKQPSGALNVATLSPGADRFDAPVEVAGYSPLGHAASVNVDTEGTLHVVWVDRPAGGATIQHAVSTDGARTFEKRNAPTVRALTVDRPAVAVKRAGGLLICWSEAIAGATGASPAPPRSDVKCSVSNKTDTFGAAVVVDSVTSADMTMRLPAVAANDLGLWALAYRETRDTRVVNLYRSTDDGVTWHRAAELGARPVNRTCGPKKDQECGRFFPGHYVALAATGKRLYAAYVLRSSGPDRTATLYITRVER